MNLYQENLKTGWVLNITTNKHSVKRTVTQKKSFISFKVSYEVVKNPPETQEKACIAGDMFSIPGSGKIPWRKKWQPTLVFLPGEFHGQRSLVGYSPWGCKESDTTEQTHAHEIKYSPHNPVIQLWFNQEKWNYVSTKDLWMFIEALLITAKDWEQPKQPSADEWDFLIVVDLSIQGLLLHHKKEHNLDSCNNMDESFFFLSYLFWRHWVLVAA